MADTSLAPRVTPVENFVDLISIGLDATHYPIREGTHPLGPKFDEEIAQLRICRPEAVAKC
ncbi:hypothetical protein ACC723_37810, partial [Rhizobium ruizarguesonis]